MPAGDALVDDDVGSPSAAEVAEAFRGHPLALPMLSTDGKLAASDVSIGLGLRSFSTYEVAFLDSTGAVRGLITVVDHVLATAMMDDETRAEGRRRWRFRGSASRSDHAFPPSLLQPHSRSPAVAIGW